MSGGRGKVWPKGMDYFISVWEDGSHCHHSDYSDAGRQRWGTADAEIKISAVCNDYGAIK